MGQKSLRLQKNYYFKKGGFTLIEIMVVIAIIGTLASIFMANVVSSINRGRDGKRKGDLRSVAQGLELYYNDLGAYPTALPTPGNAFAHPADSTVIFMQKIPGDPVSSKKYCYTSAGANYKLYANLENTKDPQVIPTIACSGVNYNYGISSANTTP